MTSIRMIVNELRRLLAGRLPKLALLAMVLIPSMYAGLYLWANHDPYGRLTNLDAALVVEDQPAKARGKTIDAGQQVAEQLRDEGSFRWHTVGRAEAAQGVEDGTYAFVLTIPRGFSSALASTAEFDPRKGSLTLTTNEANNYLSSTIAERVLTTVSSSISTNVSEQAANSFLLGYSTLHDKLKQAGEGADELAAGLGDTESGSARLASGARDLASGERTLLRGQKSLHSGISSAADGADDLRAGARTLAGGLSTLQQGTASLPAQIRKLASGARQVSAGDAKIAGIGDDVAKASGDFTGGLDRTEADIRRQLERTQLSEQQIDAVIARIHRLRKPIQRVNKRVQNTSGRLDTLSAGAREVADGASRLHRASVPLTRGIRRAHSGANALASGSGRIANGLDSAESGSAKLVDGQRDARDGSRTLASGARSLHGGLVTAHDGAKSLASGLRDGIRSIPDLNASDRDATAKTIASPVSTTTDDQAAAGTYGRGLAPFFMALAGWIGAYVVFLLVRPLSNRAMAARQLSLRVAFAGWCTPALVAVAQVVAMVCVVRFAVGIGFAHALAATAFLVLAGATYVAIVHALNAWLGAVGQLIGLLLLVLQLVSGGGTFPWQTLPGPLQVLHHVFPMSYVIDGLRHLMYGGPARGVPLDCTVLMLYLLASLALTTVAARRQRTWTAKRIKPELAL